MRSEQISTAVAEQCRSFTTPQEFGEFRDLEKIDGRFRFRKDILRCGRWNVNGEEWNVTPEVLQQIARNFSLAKSRGCDCHFVWGHSSDARDLAGDVDAVFVKGDTLLADVSTPDPEDARQIRNKANRVSVRVHPEWKDGHGNVYHEHLLHVGIVQHPVVTGQGPFIELSLVKEKNNMGLFRSQKPRDLADVPAPDAGGAGGNNPIEDAMSGATPAASKAGFDRLKQSMAKALEVIAKLESSDSLKLSTTVTDETLLTEFDLKVNFADGLAGGSNPAPPAGADPASPDAMSLQDLRNAYKELKARNLSLEQSAQVKDLEGKAKARVAYMQKLDTFSSKGVIDGAIRKSYEGLGEIKGYDLSLLAPLESISGRVVPTRSKARSLATSQEPNIEDGQKAFSNLSADEQKKEINNFWG